MFSNKKVIFYELGLKQIGEKYIYYANNKNMFRNLMRIKNSSSFLYAYIYLKFVHAIINIK